jgi:hypothetical protein
MNSFGTEIFQTLPRGQELREFWGPKTDLQDFAQKKTPRFLRTLQVLLGIFEVPQNLKNPNFTEEKMTPFFP